MPHPDSRNIIITTRPDEDARNDCAELAKIGITCLPAPMLTIIPLNADLTEGNTADAVVLTSRHAATLLSSSALCKKPCYCVGKSTADAARLAGFSDITTGPGDGAGLASCIAKDNINSIFWASAVDTGFNMAGALAKHGISVFSAAVYKAEVTTDFPDDIKTALADDRVTAVLVHSGRAGAHFYDLMQNNGFNDKLAEITAITISPRASGLCGGGWRNIIAVKSPFRSAMFDAAHVVLHRQNIGDENI